MLKGGPSWRLLPRIFPPWKTVYHVFRAWSLHGTWAALNDALRGRDAQPSAAILDRQSVKSDGHGGAVGYDAGTKIKGRKRHLRVDTLGLVLGAVVTPADCPERDGAQQARQQVSGWCIRLHRLWVDGGYTGDHPSLSGCAPSGPHKI